MYLREAFAFTLGDPKCTTPDRRLKPLYMRPDYT
jgi:hypothetical protein